MNLLTTAKERPCTTCRGSGYHQLFKGCLCLACNGRGVFSYTVSQDVEEEDSSSIFHGTYKGIDIYTNTGVKKDYIYIVKNYE
jgi:hypothetical protein